MKIGIYVSSAAVRRGYERNVSGHIQIPLRAIELLRQAGHDARLITNRYDEQTHTLPACMPTEAPVHLVDDARVRGDIHNVKGAHRKGVRLGIIRQQLKQVRAITRTQQLDVLHLFGMNRTAHFAGFLRLLGLRTPIVCTLFHARFPERFGALTKPLWRRVDGCVTATSYVQNELLKAGVQASIVRHGAVRDLRAEIEDESVGEKRRVLFWRDPSMNNGADVCAAVYDALAPKYTELSFDLAIRPYWAEVEGLDELATRHDNVHIYRFPYEPGVSLPKLVLESLCVLLPFRHMTINPQLAIAESLAAGVPVVATDLWSTNELISPGRNGELTPVGDADATIRAVEQVIENREQALEMGRNAAIDFAEHWNWDRFVDETLAVYESCGASRGATR